MSSKTSYDLAAEEDRRYFADGEVAYENDHMILVDVTSCLPKMHKPWPQRTEGVDDVKALFLHHKASWNGYKRMQSYVENHRCWPANPKGRKQNRIAYTMGVLHDPPLTKGKDGVVKPIVWKFNNWTDISYHSGSNGADTVYFKEHYIESFGTKKANSMSVALNFGGFFFSRDYPENHPDDPNPKAVKRDLGNTLIIRPSKPQIRAAYGVFLMLQGLFPNFDTSAVFGHKDSGKVACPGDTGYAFAEALRDGTISDEEALERWIDHFGIPDAGYPEVSGKPSTRQYQWLLVKLGYDLGKYGPHRDGVDGQWGRATTNALLDFEEKHALLENGEPDLVDYDALVGEYRAVYSEEPHFKGVAFPLGE